MKKPMANVALVLAITLAAGYFILSDIGSPESGNGMPEQPSGVEAFNLISESNYPKTEANR